MGGGGHDSYKIELSSGQLLRVVAQQSGIDIVLTISPASGPALARVDRPNGSRGRETISVIAPSSGSYLLSIRSLENVAGNGQYNLFVEHLRKATGEDRTWIAAEQSVSKAECWRAQSTAESFQRAISEFNRAEELWRTVKQPYEQAVALYGSGTSSASLGENQKAIEYLSRSLLLFDHDPHGSAISTAALGWPYMYLGENNKSEENFAAAFQLYQAEGNLRGEGIALYGKGWVQALRGQNEEARKTFSDSLTLRRAAKDRRGEALTLTGIGKIESRLGNQKDAITSLTQALALLSERDYYARADVLSNLGWVFGSLNKDDTSLDYFNQALAQRRLVGDRIGEATTLYGISEAQCRLGHFQEALAAIENAVTVIESLRMLGSNQQLRISYFASIQDYFDYYISLLMSLDKVNPSLGYAARALHTVERARARGLIDLLPEAKVDLRDDIDQSLLDLEHINNEQLDAVGARRYKLLSGKHTAEELQILNRQMNDLVDQSETVKRRIREANPRYAAIIRPKPLTAAQIQGQMLDADTLLLEYSLGEDRSYLWAVTREKMTSYDLPGRKVIDDIAASAYADLTARNRVRSGEDSEAKRKRVAEADTRANEQLRNLSEILLSPVAERLGFKTLVIVTQGSLQFIPFAALPAPKTVLAPRTDEVEHPLIADHQIVVLPSATTLSVLREEVAKKRPPEKAVAVFADPVYDSRDPRVANKNPRATDRAALTLTRQTQPIDGFEGGFPRLLSSLWEGKKIAEFGDPGQSKLYVNLNASRSAAMSDEVRKYRFLHFAAHALIDNDHPELSGIVLSLVDADGRPQNGFLRSNEIFNLRLSADLVVLSACRTGLGKDFKGEGSIGLTRGFMYAGAPRVVSSLWDVEDKPTSELMVRFYGRMLGPQRLSAAAGLRAAQVEMSKDPRWRAPYFWAGFVLQGEWR